MPVQRPIRLLSGSLLPGAVRWSGVATGLVLLIAVWSLGGCALANAMRGFAPPAHETPSDEQHGAPNATETAPDSASGGTPGPSAMGSSLDSAHGRPSVRPPDAGRGAASGGPLLPAPDAGLPLYDPYRSMIDLRHMCTGRRRAVVVIDPNRPQRLRGCVRFPAGYHYDRLADLVNEYTALHAEVDTKADGTVGYADRELLSAPMIGSWRERVNAVVYVLTRDGGLAERYIRDGGSAPGATQR
jgi:hypothetical protein